MVCARCGTAAGPHDAFCRVCGLALTAQQAPTAVPHRADLPRPDDDTEVLRRDDIANYRPAGAPPPQRPARRPAQRPQRSARPARRSPGERRKRALAGIGAVVVLLALVWGAVFLAGGRDSDTANATPGPTRGRLETATSPPTSASSSPSARASTSATSPPSTTASSAAKLAARKAQAAAVRSLVDRSTQARSSIGIALTAINQCKSIDESVRRLQDAAGLRRSLNATLSRQPVDALPGGGALRSALSRAFTESAAADDDYAAWGKEVRSCKKRPPRTANYANAGRHDQQATAAKRDFVQRWNAIAAGSGQPGLDPGRI